MERGARESTSEQDLDDGRMDKISPRPPSHAHFTSHKSPATNHSDPYFVGVDSRRIRLIGQKIAKACPRTRFSLR